MGSMTKFLNGFTPYREEDAKQYHRLGWWAGLTFGDILDRAADSFPHKEAFVDGESRLTFAQARDKASRLAIGLMSLGIGPTERVLVQLPNWNEFVCVYFALQKIGAIDVLLIDRYRQNEINHLIRLTGASTWVLPRRYKNTDYLPIIKDVLKESPQVKNVILVRDGGQKGYLALEQLIQGATLTGKIWPRWHKDGRTPCRWLIWGLPGGPRACPRSFPAPTMT
jgi:2,3-dihydroxybenzoate-AMP ligase